ncbi:18424_t:CDS:2, partial [Funneliformis geosporum]
ESISIVFQSKQSGNISVIISFNSEILSVPLYQAKPLKSQSLHTVSTNKSSSNNRNQRGGELRLFVRMIVDSDDDSEPRQKNVYQLWNFVNSKYENFYTPEDSNTMIVIKGKKKSTFNHLKTPSRAALIICDVAKIGTIIKCFQKVPKRFEGKDEACRQSQITPSNGKAATNSILLILAEN